MSYQSPAAVQEVLCRFVDVYQEAHIEEAHYPLHCTPDGGLFGSPYFTEWARYNGQLTNQIRSFVRYEKQLAAWIEILKDDESLTESDNHWVRVDFVEPILQCASDLPRAINDAVVHGATILRLIAKKGKSGLLEATEIKQNAWYARFKKESAPDEPLRNSVDAYFNSEASKHFMAVHGLVHHDVASTTDVGYQNVRLVDGGGLLYGCDSRIDLTSELRFLSAARIEAQHLYTAFYEYAKAECPNDGIKNVPQ